MFLNTKGPLTAAVMVGGLALAGAADAALLVDRGLPGANLNNGAGSDRSNVAWEFGSGGEYVGDTFSLTAGDWHIDTIRTWVILGGSGADNDTDLSDETATLGDTFDSLELFVGTDPNGMSSALAGNFLAGTNDTDNAAISVSRVQYPGGGSELDYQGSSGAYLSVFQIDWNIDMTLTGGGDIYFGVDGYDPFWFNHASNASLSGTPQDGADDLMHVWDGTTYLGTFDSDRTSTAGTLFNGGWDKSSDINVQVFGTQVPEPGTIALFGLGVAALGWRRRRSVR